MSRQRGTPHWGSSGKGRASRGSSLKQDDGYDTSIYMPMHTLIDEWEARLVTEHLAKGTEGRHLNHDWIIKNMMGSLMEEMVSNWNYTRSSVLLVKTKLIELDTQLNKMDATLAWKCVAMGLYTTRNVEGGSDSVTGAPTASLDNISILMMSTTTNAPFLVPSTITLLSNKRVRDIEVPVCKSSPLSVKQPKNTTKEDFQGGCPI